MLIYQNYHDSAFRRSYELHNTFGWWIEGGKTRKQNRGRRLKWYESFEKRDKDVTNDISAVFFVAISQKL